MRIFTCAACQQLIFYENVSCTSCGRPLGFLPEYGVVSALDPDASKPGRFVALTPLGERALYRECKNSIDHTACSWFVRDDDPDELCRACRLNIVLPDLEQPDALAAWRKLERAKRRLLYTLMQLGLPITSRAERSDGLAFAFMADGELEDEKVFTGHADGLITINIAEADDPFREQIRKDMGEAYRTVLGHFRHEIGHYYWDLLVQGTPWLERFRALFGDETRDYAEALKAHYEHGAPADWMQRYVSGYATMHPWEDWAETWAHYLHMVDSLDTAHAYGVVLEPKPEGGPALPTFAARGLDPAQFDQLLSGFRPLTLALNAMNRSMGLADPYPFVLTEHASAKLRFVHDVVASWRAAPSEREALLARWPQAEPKEDGEAAVAAVASDDTDDPLAAAAGDDGIEALAAAGKSQHGVEALTAETQSEPDGDEDAPAADASERESANGSSTTHEANTHPTLAVAVPDTPAGGAIDRPASELGTEDADASSSLTGEGDVNAKRRAND